MTLSSGTKLGLYEVVAMLGAGGMGEVYRATDTKLGRSVAVKVLPEAFEFDADRVQRFEREAKVLASLNHPHIAALYGMEEAGGRHFLVMELVEGETLAERHAISVQQALEYARQIADALEAAHEKGIVHRDLKPANVKITPDDKVKVLDFGLAKAMETAPAAGNLTNSPTFSMAATQAGMILGTAAYMSPEQAKGFQADPRRDVFSFGVTLYTSNETGRGNIYVQPFPPTGAKYQISKDIGYDPIWSPDGKELFYALGPGQTVVVSITTQPIFTFSNPVSVPHGGRSENGPNVIGRNSDIISDGKRFVGVIDSGSTPSAAVPAPQIQVVLNWLEELKQRVPVK
jgi:serine/threonine protein kinase